jgi:2,4-dienoyl-CoA reductase-like NADH-dependent reductase (Old Yellow Enzyme family)
VNIADAESRHPALRPVRVAGLNLPNRLAVAPMTRVSATPEGTPTSRMAQYYAEFARGGFGLVISEGTYTDDKYSQGYLNQPGIVTDEHVVAWCQVTERVHMAGGLIVQQLMHAGALSQGNAYRQATAGPSAVRPLREMLPEYGGSGPWPVPQEMTASDLDDVIAGFVAAAEKSLRAGFDGIEVHAANGYLLDQFLTDYTNERTDHYGGEVINRVRLTVEVVAAIRGELGPDAVVGVRLSQGKVNDFTYRWPGGARDAELVFGAMETAGANYLHVASEGRKWIETATLDTGVTITALARKTSDLPVIANGGMHDPIQAAEVLEGGHADVLSLGVGALANPDLPRRLASGAPLAEFDHQWLQPMATLDNTDRHRRGIGTAF